MDTPVEMRTQVQSRASSYAFLAWLFLEQPDTDFITRLLADDLQDKLCSLTSSSLADSRMITGLQLMRSSLQVQTPTTIEDTCLALAVERTRLLRGVARDYGPPPPYESLYRSPEASGGISYLVQVAEYYRFANIDLSAECADRLDYLGLELDFMRLLCEEELRLLSQGDITEAEGFAHLQHRFLHEHLLPWVPQYCQSLLSHSATGFYQGVAQLLLGFLEDQAVIETEHWYKSLELSNMARSDTGKVR